MLQRGYFELSQWSCAAFGLKALAMVGNMIYNQRHWQNGVEILASLVGPLQIEVEDQHFSLEPGDLMVIDAGTAHSVASHTPGSAQLIFNIDNAFVRRGDAPYLWLSTVGPQAIGKGHPAVCSLRRTITALAELCAIYWADNQPAPPHTKVADQHWYQARILTYQILEILSDFAQDTPVISFREASSDLFVQCVEYVHQHCAEKLSAEIVAHAVGYSASSVYRLFKQYTGVSFNEYLHTIRIHMACGLLQQNRYHVTEISWMCGFASSSSFYRCFQQMLGVTPVQYRRSYHSFYTNASEIQDKLLHYNSYQAFRQLPFQWADIWRMVEQLEQACGAGTASH